MEDPGVGHHHRKIRALSLKSIVFPKNEMRSIVAKSSKQCVFNLKRDSDSCLDLRIFKIMNSHNERVEASMNSLASF